MGRLCSEGTFCILVVVFVAIHVVDSHYTYAVKGSSSKGSGSSSTGSSHSQEAHNGKPCDSHPCQHGAKCLNKGAAFECVCTSGCSGKRCENGPKQSNPCASSPCQNSGVCHQKDSSYICSCPAGYQGNRCQYEKTPKTTHSGGSGSRSSKSSEDKHQHLPGKKSSSSGKSSSIEVGHSPPQHGAPCDSHPCKHDGRCVNQGSTFECVCRRGCSGKRCENGPEPSNPCDSSPCLNGGVCNEGGSSYSCACPAGFLGKRCQNEKTPKTTHSGGSGSRSSKSSEDKHQHLPGKKSSSSGKSSSIEVGHSPQKTPKTTHSGSSGSRSSKGSGNKQPKLSGKSGSSSKSSSGDKHRHPKGSGSSSKSSSGDKHRHPKRSNSESDERWGYYENPCDSKPCNGGHCYEYGKSFKCRCQSGFKGRRCQFKKKLRKAHRHGSKSSGSSSSAEIPVPQPCDLNPCWNGGTCVPQGDPYTCKCAPGYNGRLCQIAPQSSPCEKDPCSGNGKCYPKREGGYMCECDPNYGGSRCDRVIQINPCDKSPCKNDGRCLTRGADYQCHCMYPYEGINCEQVQPGPCEGNPCENGGTCFPVGQDFTCQCLRQFEGKRCEKAIDIGPCENEPCFNGGTCEPRGTDFECKCKPSYTGKRCDSSPNVNDHVILETTNGEMENVDIPLMAFYTHSSYLLRFSVMCYDSVRIGFKSAVYSHVYYYVYFGKTSARIEHCENKCKTVAEADIGGKLSATAFANFYIRFTSTGSMIVGLLDASFTELMTFNNEPPTCPLLVFVSSGDGYVATWKIYEAITEQVNTITWRTVNVNLRTDHYVYVGESLQIYDRQMRVGLAINSEVSVLLSKGYDDVNAYEIVFRAEGNTKLLIKKNKEVVKEADCVINSSSQDDYEDFWISFAKKTISVGRVGLDIKPAFITWSDTSPLEISLAAFKGAPSSYLVYYKFEYQTARGIFWTFDCDMAYPLPFEKISVPKHGFEFGLTADCDAHFSVSPTNEDSPTAKMYELVIGAEDNTKCLIRKCKECDCLAEVDCPHILDKNKEVEFTFEFELGHLKLFKGKGATKSPKPIISCEDPEPLADLQFMAFSTGFRSDGESHWKTYNV